MKWWDWREAHLIAVVQSLCCVWLFLWHSSLLCSWVSPRVCSASCPVSPVMLSNHFILCHPFFLLPSIFPSIRVFSNELVLCIRWPKYWNSSFSISSSNEYSELASFRIDWFDLCAVQGTPPAPQFKSINSLALSLLYASTLTSIHDYWKNYSSD